MDLHQLRLLRELRDRGSVAAVAQSLHISPSAVSQHLAALQRSCPVPLTQRTGRTLSLTPAGEALADAAVDVVAAMDRARRAVAEHLEDPTGVVSVAAFHSAGLTWFPPLLHAFRAGDGPRVVLSDEDVATENFPRLIADYDLVVAHRPARGRGWPRTTSVQPLIFEPLDIVMAADHPLASRPVLDVADLRGTRWVAVHAGFPLEPVIHSLQTMVGEPLTIVHRINEFAVARAVVATGDLLALSPRYTATPPPDSGVVMRPLGGVRIGRHIDALARPEKLQRRAVATVLRTLRDIARESTAGPADGSGPRNDVLTLLPAPGREASAPPADRHGRIFWSPGSPPLRRVQ